LVRQGALELHGEGAARTVVVTREAQRAARPEKLPGPADHLGGTREGDVVLVVLTCGAAARGLHNGDLQLAAGAGDHTRAAERRARGVGRAGNDGAGDRAPADQGAEAGAPDRVGHGLAADLLRRLARV